VPSAESSSVFGWAESGHQLLTSTAMISIGFEQYRGVARPGTYMNAADTCALPRAAAKPADCRANRHRRAPSARRPHSFPMKALQRHTQNTRAVSTRRRDPGREPFERVCSSVLRSDAPPMHVRSRHTASGADTDIDPMNRNLSWSGKIVTLAHHVGVGRVPAASSVRSPAMCHAQHTQRGELPSRTASSPVRGRRDTSLMMCAPA